MVSNFSNREPFEIMVKGSHLPDARPSAERLTRFLFDDRPIRGGIVHLDSTWRSLLADRPYPAPVRDLLGQALAAAPLLASSLKFEGRVSLQLDGTGLVDMLIVQVTHNLEVRGMARHGEVGGQQAFRDLVGQSGRLALNLDPVSAGQRYQAWVELQGGSLAASLEGYFQQSEQLPTRLWLAADGHAAAGLMLQRLPGKSGPALQEDWDRLTQLAGTVGARELLTSEPERLLQRLFVEEPVRVFPARRTEIVCRCAQGRIAQMLLALGREEVEGILREQGRVEVECGFCGRKVVYGRAGVDALFNDAAGESPSGSVH